MRSTLLTIALLLFGSLALPAQVVLEDFEGGMADLPWNAFEGTYNGPVMNPEDTTGINPSEWAGSYTKAGDREFSFFVAQLADPLDLSVNNQFSIQIYAGAATQLLLKLEGGGEEIDQTVNIATDSVWRTYTFDFSAAAGFTGLTDIILFFDPGVETSADTYLFDNLIASPAGICAGTEPDPTIIDDFECQRNATYGVPGFNDIRAVDNPDMSGINTSDGVGEYTDRQGAFHAMVINYNSPIDLSTNNYICMKVWAPVTGNLLFKLEGVSPAVETPVAIEETETWVEACVDFSASAGASYSRLVFFFNAGVAEADGDIYYIDDITRKPAPEPEALEDFEDGASLSWMPLNDDNTLHGTFSVIPNPDQTEPNTSDNVGSYVRGTANFSTLTSVLPNGIDLSGNPQLNLDVWAPDGATQVTMQLLSPTEGTKFVEADITATMSWQTLNFNFEEFNNVTDFASINLLFDPQTMGTGTYYFDNLAQGSSTVDPCADVVPDPSILDDFECQRNANYTVGAGQLTAIPNPDVSNANTSARVGEFRDGTGSFEALVIDFGGPVDLTVNNQLSVQVWSPGIVPLLFKWEGGSGGAFEERFVDVSAANEWVTYNLDFSDLAGSDFTRLVFFFNAGNDTAEDELYYIDNIQLNRAPYVNDCIIDFESEDRTFTDWTYFSNGALTANPFIVSDNPDQSGVNTSDKVGTFEEANDGAGFAGMFFDPPAPIVVSAGNKTLTAKIWMPVAGDVVFKLESPLDGAPASGDRLAVYDTPGEWKEMTFDFSMTQGGAEIPDGARYERLTFIPNIGITPTENLTHYFDDVIIGGGNCATTGIFEPVRVDQMHVYPNPVNNRLTIENPNGATTFRITNLLGQTFETVRTDAARERLDLDLSRLPQGMYVLTAYDTAGQLTAKATFVKQ